MSLLNKDRTQIWLIVYLIYLVILTLSPFQFSIIHLKEYNTQNIVKLLHDLIYLHDYSDIIANVFLFIPFGVIFYVLKTKKSSFKSCILAVLIGGIISLIIEFAQLFLDRSSNGMDMMTY